MTANLCSFPGCKRIKGKGAYCIQHGRIYGTTTFDKAKPIAKRSEKMKVAMGELKKLAQVYLAKHQNCELKLKGCTGKAIVVHHSRGREGAQLLNPGDLPQLKKVKVKGKEQWDDSDMMEYLENYIRVNIAPKLAGLPAVAVEDDDEAPF